MEEIKRILPFMSEPTSKKTTEKKNENKKKLGININFLNKLFSRSYR